MDLNAIAAAASSRAATPGRGPGEAAAEAARGFAEALRAAEMQGEAAVTTGADPHALVTAMAEGQLAVETVVAIRDKVVEAYQEILRMPL